MDALLAAIVRGDRVEWPFTDPSAERLFLDAARRHGVVPLVARQLRRSEPRERWPEPVVAAIAASARQQAIVEQIQKTELLDLLGAFDARGVRPLVFKGTALAYTHYAYACLRPRCDTDLLVADADVDAAIQALHARGYAPLEHVTGRLVTFQQAFVRVDRHGLRHACDLHWRIANRPAFARLFGWDELKAAARPIAALDHRADAPGVGHALLLACTHRVAHHYDAAELIWIYDIHLLASSMTDAEAAHLRALAVGKGLAAICRRGLALSQRHFATSLPAALVDLQANGPEPLAAYMGERFRPIDVLVSDLRALGGWRARGRLLCEHLFPSPQYLHGARNRLGGGPLPLVYARRMLHGVWRWLRLPASAS